MATKTKPASKAKAQKKPAKPAKADKANPKPDRTKATAKATATKHSKAKQTEWLHKKAFELTKQRRKLRVAESRWESAHAAQGLAKKQMEEEQAILNSIVDDMEKIDSGNFTPPLFKEQELRAAKTAEPTATSSSAASPAEDVGGKKPLTTLISKNLKASCPSHFRDGVGLSEKQVETLEKAIDGEKTIANLEKFQRTNPIWTRSMPGFGETAITKLQDAHEIVRRAFPIPSPDDKPKPPTPAQSSANAAAASNGKPVDPMTKAFNEGQQAFRDKKELKACTFPSGTPLALKWIEGFESEKSAKSASNGQPALSETDKNKLRAAQDKASEKAATTTKA